MLYKAVKIISWIYVVLLPVALVVTYLCTWVAYLMEGRDVAIIVGVLVGTSFIVSALKIFTLLRAPLDGRVVYWLTAGIVNWLVLIGFIFYRYYFGGCCL